MSQNPDWDAELLLKHSEVMSRLKAKIFEKAKANIDDAQKKDKEYYDMKHSDPRVCIYAYAILYCGYTLFLFPNRNSLVAQLFC